MKLRREWRNALSPVPGTSWSSIKRSHYPILTAELHPSPAPWPHAWKHAHLYPAVIWPHSLAVRPFSPVCHFQATVSKWQVAATFEPEQLGHNMPAFSIHATFSNRQPQGPCPSLVEAQSTALLNIGLTLVHAILQGPEDKSQLTVISSRDPGTFITCKGKDKL